MGTGGPDSFAGLPLGVRLQIAAVEPLLLGSVCGFVAYGDSAA